MLQNELKIGCHLSSGAGYLNMAETIVELGGNTFQFFTRNPRGGQVKAFDAEDVGAYNAFAAKHGIGFVVAHAPYTMNLCSKDPSIRDFAFRVMKEDLDRLQHLNNVYYNFHPGSHVGQGVEIGIEEIASALNRVLKREQKTTVLLETMAGKGSEIGCTFEEIRAILDRVELSDHVGVCLDTCHVHEGGYDIIDHLEDVLEEFDRVIGLDRLKAIHLNDSMKPRGAHKDRHQKIGQGEIGLEALVRVISHPKLRDLPFILETPNDLEGYRNEIALLKESRR